MRDLANNQDEVFMLRHYTHKELAHFYGVCWLTFQRWVDRHKDEIGEKEGHFYSIPQVVKIFRIFGIPKRLKVTMQQIEDMFNNE
jgi:hypothetical protein